MSPKLHPQDMKYCLHCVQTKGKAAVKQVHKYDGGTVRLCPSCDFPGVTTIYDLDPHGAMP